MPEEIQVITPDMPWRDAIIKILEESNEAMHYKAVAEKVAEDGLRRSVGATPANTVNQLLNNSLREEENTPFMRLGGGYYTLRSKSEQQQEVDEDLLDDNIEEEKNTAIINAFGMFWQRDLIQWTTQPNLFGKQQIAADSVNFTEQIGVYLLYDGREVVYVGRSIDRPLGRRLYEHTQDRLGARWNRFSWFGLMKVTEGAVLQNLSLAPSIDTVISTLEALLIEGLEPPQNRRRGDDFNAIEYLQAVDPQREEERIKIMSTLFKTA